MGKEVTEQSTQQSRPYTLRDKHFHPEVKMKITEKIR